MSPAELDAAVVLPGGARDHEDVLAGSLERARAAFADAAAIAGAVVEELGVLAVQDRRAQATVAAARRLERTARDACDEAHRQRGLSRVSRSWTVPVAACIGEAGCEALYDSSGWLALARIGVPTHEPGTASAAARIIEVRRCRCGAELVRDIAGAGCIAGVVGTR